MLHGGPVERAEYVYPSGLIDTLALSRLYEDGYSVVLPHAHSHFPPLGYLIRGLEAELGCRVQANVYLSPPGAAAFAPHYDAHDVVVLQAHGRKEWTLFDGTEPVPATRPFDPGTHAAGDPVDTFVLRAGDTAYLPRGLMHHAAAEVDASLHITVGIHWVSVLDVVKAALDRAGTERPELRRALPHRWWVDEGARAEVSAEVARARPRSGTPSWSPRRSAICATTSCRPANPSCPASWTSSAVSTTSRRPPRWRHATRCCGTSVTRGTSWCWPASGARSPSP